MVTKTINTKRLDLYNKFVEEEDTEYPFEHRYELFSFVVVLGYVEGERYSTDDEDAGYSQDFIKVSDITNSSHRAAVNLVFNLTALELANESGTDLSDGTESLEQEAWTRTKEYADYGLVKLNEEVDIQEQIDFIRLFNEAEELWPDRLTHVDALFEE